MVTVQRNFECKPARLIAIPTDGTVPAVRPQLSDVIVTSQFLVGAQWHEDGRYYRHAVDQHSQGLAGEK
ncbi:MAG: hypothetical protein ABSC05_19820 [Candidatus Solibacter sp.]|jgi:hypothetical protein